MWDSCGCVGKAKIAYPKCRSFGRWTHWHWLIGLHTRLALQTHTPLIVGNDSQSSRSGTPPLTSHTINEKYQEARIVSHRTSKTRDQNIQQNICKLELKNHLSYLSKNHPGKCFIMRDINMKRHSWHYMALYCGIRDMARTMELLLAVCPSCLTPAFFVCHAAHSCSRYIFSSIPCVCLSFMAHYIFFSFAEHASHKEWEFVVPKKMRCDSNSDRGASRSKTTILESVWESFACPHKCWKLFGGEFQATDNTHVHICEIWAEESMRWLAQRQIPDHFTIIYIYMIMWCGCCLHPQMSKCARSGRLLEQPKFWIEQRRLVTRQTHNRIYESTHRTYIYIIREEQRTQRLYVWAKNYFVIRSYLVRMWRRSSENELEPRSRYPYHKK